MAAGSRRFVRSLTWIAVGGLALRVAYALSKGDQAVIGDALFYKLQSQIVAEGHGFLAPGLYAFSHRSLASAEHPPLSTLWLTIPHLLGQHGILALRLWSTVLGFATVVFAGRAGRELVGDRAGLVAAGLVATAPALVMTDGLIMSESITATTVAATIWLGARALRLRSPAAMAWAGGAAAMAALARAELVLVLPMLAIAVVARRAPQSGRQRLTLAAVMLAVGALVVTPWIVRNLVTFERPVLLSDGWDLAAADTNCRATYHGQLIGTIDFRCAGATTSGHDQSVDFARVRAKGIRYATDHMDRWPAVGFARLGRTFGFFNVGQQIQMDQDLEQRGPALTTAGLVEWWLAVAVGGYGMVVLHRRRVSLVPLLAPVVSVALGVLVTYGNTRLRVPADVALLVAAAVGVDAFLTTRRSTARGRAAARSPSPT